MWCGSHWESDSWMKLGGLWEADKDIPGVKSSRSRRLRAGEIVPCDGDAVASSVSVGRREKWGTGPCGLLSVIVRTWALPLRWEPLEAREQRTDGVWLTLEEVTPTAFWKGASTGACCHSCEQAVWNGLAQKPCTGSERQLASVPILRWSQQGLPLDWMEVWGNWGRQRWEWGCSLPRWGGRWGVRTKLEMPIWESQQINAIKTNKTAGTDRSLRDLCLKRFLSKARRKEFRGVPVFISQKWRTSHRRLRNGHTGWWRTRGVSQKPRRESLNISRWRGPSSFIRSCSLGPWS